MSASRPDRTHAADLAYLAGTIERWSADLALAEEPARFLVALDSGAPGESTPATGEGRAGTSP